jgi:hypothetical protein
VVPYQLDQTDGSGVFYLQAFNLIHIVPTGAAINANYNIKALGKFLQHFKKKRSASAMAQQQWCFQWDMCQLTWPPVWGLDGGEKDPAVGAQRVDQESLMNAWEGITRNFAGLLVVVWAG